MWMKTTQDVGGNFWSADMKYKTIHGDFDRKIILDSALDKMIVPTNDFFDVY